jgi:hypothetical protein
VFRCFTSSFLRSNATAVVVVVVIVIVTYTFDFFIGYLASNKSIDAFNNQKSDERPTDEYEHDQANT